MEITCRELSGVKVLNFSGRIIYDTEEVVKREMEKLTKNEDRMIVFNLANLSYINSSGLGLLINILKQVRARAGDIKLTNLRPELKELFKLTSLNTVFEILDSEDEAIQKFLAVKTN